MKKRFLLLIPVIVILASCDELKSKFCNCEQNIVTDTIVVHDTIPCPPDNGTVGLPANVFDETTTANISGATVVAKDGANKTVATVTSDADGNYVCPGLVSGKTYTFTARKTGYANQSKAAIYDGTSNSLPWFGMKQ